MRKVPRVAGDKDAALHLRTLPRLSLVPMDTVICFWQEDLWTYPHTLRLSASPAQNRLCVRFFHELGLVGNDVNDTWLAALAIESQAILVSQDQGFARFPGLTWLKPA